MSLAITHRRVVRPQPRASTVPLPPLIVAALLVAAFVAAVYPDHTYPALPIFAGLTLGSLVLMLNSRAWALAPMLLVEFTASDYVSPQLHISARLAVLLFVTLVNVPILVHEVRFSDPSVRAVLIPAIVLVVVATVRNAFTSDPAFVVKYARYMCELLLTLVITMSVVRTRTDIRKVAWLVVGLGIANAVAVIMQHYLPGAAPYVNASTATLSTWDGRAVGLSDSPVLLGVAVPFVLVPLLGVVFMTSTIRRQQSVRLGLTILVLAIGLYFSYTRSVFIGITAGMLTIAFYLKGSPRVALLALVFGAVVGYELLQGTGLIGSRYYSTSDDSAESHLILWIADFNIAVGNSIIGIGNGNYKQVAATYTDQVSQDVSSKAQSSLDALGTEQPHNDFLYVWLSWGIVALVAYVMIFVGALRNFSRAARSNDVVIRTLAVGCAGGLAAYAVNSAFHNYLDSSTALWLYAGASTVLARLASQAAPKGLPLGTMSRRRVRRLTRRMLAAAR